MAGNILGQGYLAGFGMTIGTVFGRIAGRGGGRHAATLRLIADARRAAWRSATPAAIARATAEEFPYTLRLVSDVLSSNGSTSMASVCASTLSMMDAGVPIKAPVAGIAMGLIAEGGQYVTLTTPD